MILIPKTWLILAVAWLIAAIAVASAQVLHSGCQSSCGDLNISYPFGTTEECYLNENFYISCNPSSDPLQPLLRNGDITVYNISLEGELTISSWLAGDCYNETGHNDNYYVSSQVPQFPYSVTRNKFTAIGCDTKAVLQNYSESTEKSFYMGCMSWCTSMLDVINGSCDGVGCCQTSIPKDTFGYRATVDSYNNHSGILDFNPCGYAFVADAQSFNFSTDYFNYLPFYTSIPAVLDWSVGENRCSEADKDPIGYICKGNSTCIDPDNGPGYRCKCSEGYAGNPYLKPENNGCQVINYFY